MYNFNMKKYDEEVKLSYNYDLIIKMDNPESYGTGFYNLNTGVFSFSMYDCKREEVQCFYDKNLKPSKISQAVYWKATSDGKFLCCIIAQINLKKIKTGDVRVFEELERYYFSPTKEVLVEALKYKQYDDTPLSDCENYRILNLSKDYRLNYNCINGRLLSDDMREVYWEDKEILFRKEFVKVFNPIFPSLGLKMHSCVIEDTKTFISMFLHKEREKEICDEQEMIDCCLSLKQLAEIPIEFFNKKDNYGQIKRDFLILEKISDDVLVIRKFSGDLYAHDYYGNIKKTSKYFIFETGRTYILDGKIYSGCFNLYGQLIALKDEEDLDCIYNIDLSMNKKDLEETCFKYVIDIIDELPDDLKVSFMRAYVKNSAIEKIYRSKLKYLALRAISNNTGKIDDSLKNIFGFDEDNKNFTKIVGLNKNQINIIYNVWFDWIYSRYGQMSEEKACKLLGDMGSDKYCISSSLFREVETIKDILGCSNISHIDDDSFKAILEIVLNPVNGTATNCIKKVNRIYGFNTAVDMAKKISSLKKEEFLYHSLRQYYDYLDMVEKLEMSDTYKAYFSDTEDLFEKHDEVMALYSFKKSEVDRKQFIKATEKITKYLYNNDKYSVIIPNDPEDVVREGRKLSHCVKTYITRIANGETNVMFIRENKNIDEPFFTVEISNKGMIHQIHGFGNRNVDTEPGLDKFVLEWVKARELKTTNYNKVR